MLWWKVIQTKAWIWNNYTKTSGIFLLSGGATEFRFITILYLVIEKTSFGNLDNSPGYEELILVYCGNGHQAYQAEIKSLYPDVALALEAGIRVKILKTGRDSYGWQKTTMLSAEGVPLS